MGEGRRATFCSRGTTFIRQRSAAPASCGEGNLTVIPYQPRSRRANRRVLFSRQAISSRSLGDLFRGPDIRASQLPPALCMPAGPLLVPSQLLAIWIVYIYPMCMCLCACGASSGMESANRAAVSR